MTLIFLLALLNPVSDLTSDALKPEVMYQQIVPKKGSYFVHGLSIKGESGSGTVPTKIIHQIIS